jgi:phosphoglycerate dehydrogenase-like enzyme
MPQNLEVVLSADFLDEHGQLVFPDIALDTMQQIPAASHRFLTSYEAEYRPEQLAGSDVVLSLKPRVTRESLDRAGRLCAVGRFGVGYDNVDLAACTENDIAVYITRNAVVRPVASSIVLMVLAASHNLVAKDRMIRRGEWVASTRKLGREPRNRVVGTIGLGNIAREAIRLLKVFDIAKFLAYDPNVSAGQAAGLGVELTTLDNVFSQSDYVLINCPLTDSTRGLAGERELRLMKRDAILVNTARGPIVDERALERILAEGVIACAALDVFEKEPLQPDSPLFGMENTILSSHSLCWTQELFRDMGRESFAGVQAIANGEPPANVVNPDVLCRPGFLAKLERIKNRV